ncbi:MAG: HD domain-containing protein [Candidatus Methylacidiphilales bacterium]
MNPAHPTALSLAAIKESDAPLDLDFAAQITDLRQSTTQGGKPYFDLSLTDATGTARLKIWSNTDAFAFLETTTLGTFVRLSGRFSRNSFGLNVDEPRLAPLPKEKIPGVLAGSPGRAADLEKDWDFLCQTAGQMTEPRLRLVSQLALNKYETKWRRAAAARAYHHARRGGLLEHTAQMTRVAQVVAPLYPEVHPDLLCAGVLFHDIGKLWENDYAGDTFLAPPSRLGEMIGHISIGIEVLNKLWHEAAESHPEAFAVTNPPSDLIREHLIHLIASHHGQREFGAPVTPRTPEAHLLHYIDNLDAKLEMVRMAHRAGHEVAAGLYETKRPLEGPIPAPLSWAFQPLPET